MSTGDGIHLDVRPEWKDLIRRTDEKEKEITWNGEINFHLPS